MKHLLLSLLLFFCAACSTEKYISIDNEIRYSSFYVYRVDSITYFSISNYTHSVTPGVRFEIVANDIMHGSFDIRHAPVRHVNYKCKSSSEKLIINVSPLEL